MGHYGVARRARLQRPVTVDERALTLMVRGMTSNRLASSTHQLAGYCATADASATI